MFINFMKIMIIAGSFVSFLGVASGKDKSKEKDSILIFTKPVGDFKVVADSLVRELERDNKVEIVNIDKDANLESFEKSVQASKPKVVVVMDNQAVNIAKEYHKKNPKAGFQTVAMMGLNLKTILKGESSICGISYEVPIYTMLTQFRFTKAEKKMGPVLTFYRASQFSDIIKDSQALLKQEGIDLVTVDVEKEASVADFLNGNGKQQVLSSKYSAVLVLLDSILLEPKLFQEFWLKTSAEAKIPFLVGTEKLVNPAFNFAMFGMSPNLSDLSSQAVQMIETIKSGDSCKSIGVEELIGVNRIWNEKKAKALDIKIDESVKGQTTLLN